MIAPVIAPDTQLRRAIAVETEAGTWEVLQFAEAELVAPDLYRLRGFLRGQRGTPVGPIRAGGRLVVLDEAVGVLVLDPGELGRTVSLRGRPQTGSLDQVWQGTAPGELGGLRPFAPVHLSFHSKNGLSWIRRTRLDGDRWDISPLPLGEVDERYRVRISRDGHADWVGEARHPSLSLDGLEILHPSAGSDAPVRVEVAQISDRVGPGQAARLDLVL